MKIKKIASAILFGVFSSSLAVYAESPATLQKIVEKAVSENPEVQARYRAFKGSELDESAAFGRYLPNVTVDQVFRDQDRLVPNVNRTNTPNQQSTLTLRQMIFDGFATPSEVSRLDHVSKSRYYELLGQMQSIAQDTAAAYFDLVRSRRLVSYAQENFVTHKQVFDRIKSRVEAGVGKRVDLEQASGRLALAEANLLTEETNLYDVVARYQRLVGELPPETLSETMMSDDSTLADTVEKVLDKAYKQNPNILASIENIVAVESSVSGRISPFMPRVDLQAKQVLDVNRQSENSTLAADTVEVTASWNIFNGFTDKSNYDSAVQELNRSHDLRDKACIDTRQLVAISYNNIRQLKDQVVYRQQHADAIEKARLAYRKQYDIGQRTLLDLLDTENEYFQARRSLTNSQMDLNISYARTYAGQGELLRKLNVSRVDLAELSRDEYLDRENVCKTVAPMQVATDKNALLANAKPWGEELVATNKAPVQEKATMKFAPRILFQPSSAVILPASYPDLDITFDIIKEWGDDRVEIAGHTDKRNTSKEKFNLILSEKRAKAVADYLIKKGANPKRFMVKGYGFSKPIAENDPVNGNDTNRRVEVIRYQKTAE